MSAIRRTAAVAAATLAVAGCGGDEEEPAATAAPRPVTGTVELERVGAGAPDAGTAAGHGGDTAAAATARPSFSFAGTVAPADSAVTLRDARRRAQGTVDVATSGAFSARITGLAPGLNRLTLTATSPGRESWRLEIRITRRAG